MKRKITLSILCFLLAGTALAQKQVSISFKKQTDAIEKKSVETVYPITINTDLEKLSTDKRKFYTLTIKPDDKKSSFPRSGYELNFNSIPLDKLKPEYTLYLTLKKDTAVDLERHLHLIFELTGEDKADTIALKNIGDTSRRSLDITIKPTRVLNSYNYLGYIGTNFDLVDGVQAKNLFFATNVFAPPKSKGDGFGFSLLLYGNRALTATDTSGRGKFPSKIVPLPGDSARTYYEEALKTATRVTDNLGASFSPLIRLGGSLSDPARETQLYYAPQFEFIWRRTKLTTIYSENVLVDSVDRANRPISNTILLTSEKEVTSFNVYDVYLGLVGAVLKHENSNISIRIQASTGINYSYTAMRNGKVQSVLFIPYDRKWNIFFFARAWITEPNSGLTFGAEVSNNFIKKNSHQPYFNVTLSKALNLNSLGKIFLPVSSQ